MPQRTDGTRSTTELLSRLDFLGDVKVHRLDCRVAPKLDSLRQRANPDSGSTLVKESEVSDSGERFSS